MSKIEVVKTPRNKKITKVTRFMIRVGKKTKISLCPNLYNDISLCSNHNNKKKGKSDISDLFSSSKIINMKTKNEYLDTIRESNPNILNKISKDLNKINFDLDKDFCCGCNDILLVDDEPSIRKAFQKIFSNLNIEADIANDGIDCYEQIIKKTKCNCDKKYYKLIILDIYMKYWDGFKTIEKIEQLRQEGIIKQNFNVVLITGHDIQEFVIPNFDFIKAVYKKPIKKETLSEIIDNYYNVLLDDNIQDS